MDNDVTVWLEIDNAWVDITRISDRARVLVGDGEPGVTLSAEVGGTRKISFRYLDSDGLLDGENPAGPYYRKIGPGTPVRVRCDGATQQVGEIAPDGIRASWDDGGRHDDGDVAVIVEVTCTDTIGRLQQNDPPLESALTRFYRDQHTNYAGSKLMHWYSFEENEAATRVEDLIGNRPLTGRAKYGNDDGPPGALRAMRQVYEARTAPVPDQSTALEVNDLVSQLAPQIGTDWTLEVCGKFPAVAVDNDNAPAVLVEWRTFGLSGYWQIRADYVTKCWELNFFNTTLSQFKITTSVVARDDEWHMIRVDVDHNAPDFFVQLYIDGVVEGTFTPTGAQTSPPKSIFIDNFEDVAGAIRPSICHLLTWNGRASGVPDPLWSYEAMLGHTGDVVGERFSRLLLENNIDYTEGGLTMGADKELGPQDELPLLEILQNSADSDASWWFSHRLLNNRIIRYALDALYNQAPTFMGEYRHLTPPFRPVPNDEIANTVKATNQGSTGTGLEVEYSIPDDDWYHWTTQAPPDGAYVRPDTAKVNLADSAGVRDVAAWRAHEKSWREKRYTAITYDLHRDQFSAADIAAVRSIDLGSMVAQGTVGAPPWIPYHEVRGLVRAWSRTLGKQTDTWVLDTIPADIYEVMTTDTSGSTLAAEIDDNDTTVKVATSDGPAWSPATQKLQVGGEAVTVSSISAMTPAFVGVGTPAHADNAVIAPALPAGMVADVGVSVFCWVSSRNPSVTLPSSLTGGWTAVLTGYSEHRLYHSYYYTGLPAPSITPSGGAAGDTISGVCFAFSGVSPHTDNTDGYGGVWPSVNSSAQNMAFSIAPVRTSRMYGLREENAVHLLLGWKQDDWTGVAPPTNYTEIFDTSSTLGDDQGIWGAYRILTDPTAYPGTTVTVTGGGAAISKTFVVALRPLQEATVVRGVAGPASTHVAGSEIHAWHMGVRAL